MHEGAGDVLDVGATALYLIHDLATPATSHKHKADISGYTSPRY